MRLSLLVFLATVASFGQTGSLIGTIRTAAGAGVPISKVPVKATNTATGTSYSAQSSADGSYKVEDLSAGVYDISINYPPFFLPFHEDKIEVSVGKPTRVDAKLKDLTLETLGDGGVEFAFLLADHPAPTGPAPRSHDGKPDLSGVWISSLPFPTGETAEPLPWAAELIKKHNDPNVTDNPTAHCLPGGIVFFFSQFRLLQTPDEIAMLNGGFDPPREIYLDGRGHPTEFNPSWMGHSVGHWEGDTLVVDTVGFNDRGWLMNGPQTEQLHVTERFRRVDLGHMETEVTIDDPGVYKKPWKLKRVNSLMPKTEEIQEYVCAENNRDVQHLVGNK